MKRLPRQVTLAGERWRVGVDRRLAHPLTDAGLIREFRVRVPHERLLGFTNHEARTIRLAPDLRGAARDEILLHELLHAAFPRRLVRDGVEERIVSGLARTLARVVTLRRRR